MSNAEMTARRFYSVNELEDRISQATKEAVSGDSMPIDMFFEEAEKKYPWLLFC